MRWVAPTERDDANHALEKRLWDGVGPGRRFPFGLPRTGGERMRGSETA